MPPSNPYGIPADNRRFSLIFLQSKWIQGVLSTNFGRLDTATALHLWFVATAVVGAHYPSSFRMLLSKY